MALTDRGSHVDTDVKRASPRVYEYAKSFLVEFCKSFASSVTTCMFPKRLQLLEDYKEAPWIDGPVKDVPPIMTVGAGKNSYVKNSSGQEAFMERHFPNMLKWIVEMEILAMGELTDVVRVVDLGCSSGPNTIRNVEMILRRMKQRYSGREGPEFQAFFQDLHETDFNTLFQFLKTVSTNSAVSTRVSDDLKYFAAGIPGSCYDQVLPQSSIQFVLSTFTLHWLSQVPPIVYDKSDKAYYGSHKELQFASKATIDAYAEQGKLDLGNFLDARATEMVPGGVMNLVFGVRKANYPYYVCPTDVVSEKVWDDMISEGLVEAQLRESYKGFMYFHYLKDAEQVLDNYSSFFKTEYREVFPFFSYEPGMTAHEKGARLVSLHRGINATFLEGHFGKDATEMFWPRYEKAVLQGFTDGTIVDYEETTYSFLVVVASRKFVDKMI